MQNAAAMPALLSEGCSTYSWQWHSNGMIHFSLAHFEFVRILNNYSLSCRLLVMSSDFYVLYCVLITAAYVIRQVDITRSLMSTGWCSESVGNQSESFPSPNSYHHLDLALAFHPRNNFLKSASQFQEAIFKICSIYLDVIKCNLKY